MSRTRFSRVLSLACAAAGIAAAGPVAAGSPGSAPVVGGHPAPVGKWQDVAAVTDGVFPFCTGTLIGPRVVLTAGHCVDGSEVTAVNLGAVDSRTGGEEIAVVQATAHPDWENTYDVSVLVLAEPSVFTPRPVATDCIVREALHDDSAVTLVGFGATTVEGDDFNTTLMEGEAHIIDVGCTGGDGCAPAVSPGGEFVAGGAGVDSCFGDSGGPVYLDTPDGIVLAGVVSRGLDSATTPCGGGGIYVRPDAVLDWIEATAGQPITRATCAATEPEDPTDGAGGDDSGTDDGSADDGGSTGDGSGTGATDGAPGDITGGCAAAPGGDHSAWSALAFLGLVAAIERRRS
ncbi:MAG TPA: serine protease [Kofleriaceae bacterium]|nr:serine protease [Kofleriaceae bacterium]